jgi:hypothetical protein
LVEIELGVSDKQYPFVKYEEVLPCQRFEECAVDLVAIFETILQGDKGAMWHAGSGRWSLTDIRLLYCILHFCPKNFA